MHGGLDKTALTEENVDAVIKGFANLKQHIQNMQQYQIPVVVAINEFVTDTQKEFETLEKLCQEMDVNIARASVWADGGKGGRALAQVLVDTIDMQPSNYQRLYQDEQSIEEKCLAIVQKIYHGKQVTFSKKALNQLATFKKEGWDKLPVCMAKTQYSFADDPSKLGAPQDFEIHIREFVPKLGAGFIVALTGDVMTMPGLPKKPAALNMDVDEKGNTLGLF